MKPLKWEKINIGTHLTNEMTSFHTEIKNFVYMYTVEPLERFEDDGTDAIKRMNKYNTLYELIKSDTEIDEKYLMDMDRVIPFVFSVRELTKLVDVVSEKAAKSLYFRFFPYKGRFLVTKDCVPVEWKQYVAKEFFGKGESDKNS